MGNVFSGTWKGRGPARNVLLSKTAIRSELIELTRQKVHTCPLYETLGRFDNPQLQSENISIGNSWENFKILMFRVLQTYHKKKFSWELSLLKIGGIISGGSTAARSPISAASAGNGSRPPAISTTTGWRITRYGFRTTDRSRMKCMELMNFGTQLYFSTI